MKSKLSFLILAVLVISCSTDPEKFIDNIGGYWEIEHVKENNFLVKEYNISTTIDYFEVRDDFSGFRKKVLPALNGKYLVSKHSTPFNLKIEEGILYILYNANGNQFREKILKASKDKLIITNAEGLKYTYKPYEKIDIQ